MTVNQSKQIFCKATNKSRAISAIRRSQASNSVFLVGMHVFRLST